MTNLKELEALLVRVLTAGGTDRDLSWDLWLALGVCPSEHLAKMENLVAQGASPEDLRSWASHFAGYDWDGEYTTSTEAAIKLVELALPNWWWSVGRCDLTCHASVGADRAHFDDAYLDKHGDGYDADLKNPSTPALALLAALLRAEIATHAEVSA